MSQAQASIATYEKMRQDQPLFGLDRDRTVPQLNAYSTADDYVRAAVMNNPGLMAAYQRWRASLQRIPQARSLEDPTVSFTYFVDQLEGRYQVSLIQMIPAFGTLHRQETQAAAEARAALYAFETRRFELYQQVMRAFYEYWYLSRLTGITAEQVRLLSELEQTVEARYQAGSASFADISAVRFEKEQRQAALSSMHDERRMQSAGLAALLAVGQADVFPWPNYEPRRHAGSLDEQVLSDVLNRANPELKASEALVAAAAARYSVARRNQWPRVMLGVDYMAMPEMSNGGRQSDVGLMVGITVPLWLSKNRAERRELFARHQAAVFEHDQRQLQLRAELSRLVFRYWDAQRHGTLFSTKLIPKAEQAVAVAQQAYADGRIEFKDLLDAQSTLLEFRQLAERATVDREVASVDIHRLVGLLDISDFSIDTMNHANSGFIK